MERALISDTERGLLLSKFNDFNEKSQWLIMKDVNLNYRRFEGKKISLSTVNHSYHMIAEVIIVVRGERAVDELCSYLDRN